MLAYQVCEWTRSVPCAAGRHRQVGPEGAQGGVGVGEAGRDVVRRDALLGPRPAHAVDADVDQPTQLAGEVLHMDPGTAVDLGRVLAGEQVDAHGVIVDQQG